MFDFEVLWGGVLGVLYVGGVLGVQKWGPKIVKNGPRVWAFCKIEFPGIQKPVQILTQKSRFFRNPGNRGVGVIWLVRRGLIVLMLVVLTVWIGWWLWLVALGPLVACG